MRISTILFAAAATLVSVAPALADGPYKFALVPKAMNNPFFDLSRDGCMAEAQKLGNVECIYKGPVEHEPAGQVQIIQDFISQGIDGLAISVSDADAVVKVIQQARDANIAVMTYDADAPNSARQSNVGSDNKQMGVEMGKLLLKLRPEGGKFAIISGGPAAANLAERVDGVREALKGSKWEEIASGSPTFCNDDASVAIQQMNDLKTANPDLAAIIPVGGWPLYVPEAFKSFMDKYKDEREAGKFSVVAADTLQVELELLRDGYVSGLIGQRPAEMGAIAMQTLLALKQGKEVEPVIRAGLDAVTQDNVKDFLK